MNRKETTTDSGLIVVTDDQTIEKRERMTRAEWAAYKWQEEITEEEYIEEQRTFRRPLNAG